MHLRKLELQDAPLMLEWMQDEDVVRFLAADFREKTILDCEDFIRESENSSINLHMAVASDIDEYMGTVSLKHIDRDNGNAEFAISMRKNSMGRGYAWFGMTEIIRIAFEVLGLTCIYWNVSEDDKRACRFFDKHGFHQVIDINADISKRYRGINNLRWYSVLVGDDYLNEALARGEVAGCQVINIQTIPTFNAGELSFFETNKDIAFGIKRIYYISKVPEGVRRGFHAHKELKQVLFCPYGTIQLILDDGHKKEEITLSDPSIGIIIDKPVWREMLWLKKDSVLCVAASDFYDAEDYIRDYDEFLAYKASCIV